jgi:hypothetical protein
MISPETTARAYAKTSSAYLPWTFPAIMRHQLPRLSSVPLSFFFPRFLSRFRSIQLQIHSKTSMQQIPHARRTAIMQVIHRKSTARNSLSTG